MTWRVVRDYVLAAIFDNDLRDILIMTVIVAGTVATVTLILMVAP
jgi:hypothetical protein